MKPQALFLVTLAVVAILAALPHAESKGCPKPASWPCCDDCGVCNKKFPPECFCRDVSLRGCHPACKDCEKSNGEEGKPGFECKDSITNFCLRRCTPAA
ncbi:hypothetical protein PR202_gb04217 [Eleusine coracana subsp. coracana]|uniref:Bowman-Birk serine protease inhibitors family domain-containing protein n=1 Tax=Eleusine coracana subsp. coracana TaxID=191504 RepID=A0AAV5E3Z6_ELECO|nr:hypothetical protein QOZ80_1BG0089880 [Eleusine coracana subsp. coracana]GJN17168.1 hypothetical protein PR202_gb04217 [Eleusine coracana subsp. coracana]